MLLPVDAFGKWHLGCRYMRAISLRLVVVFLVAAISHGKAEAPKPLRIGVAGLVHGHINGLLRQKDQKVFEIVGISESDKAVVDRLSKEFGFDKAKVYPTVEELLDATKPDAVVAFGSTRDHLPVIRASAERGLDVMVEKPLSLTAAEANAIVDLAKKHNIQVLTNYETTWYPTVREMQRLVKSGDIGEVRKMVARDGHTGPKEIGCPPEFLNWLTDPDLNGAGALMDFGCYGANIMTWLMDGKSPEAVTAVTQHFKSDSLYAKVDDEATIVVVYPKAQGLIQASWNWPFNRKDFELYGSKGAVFADDSTHLRERLGLNAPVKAREIPFPEAPYNDPFAYLAAVVRGEVNPAGGLSSLENNVVVMKILDAARASAKSGQLEKIP